MGKKVTQKHLNRVQALSERTTKLMGAVILDSQAPGEKQRPEIAAQIDAITSRKGASVDDCKFILDKILMASGEHEASADTHARLAQVLRGFGERMLEHLGETRRKKNWKHGKGSTWRVDVVPREYSVKFTVVKKSGGLK